MQTFIAVGAALTFPWNTPFREIVGLVQAHASLAAGHCSSRRDPSRGWPPRAGLLEGASERREPAGREDRALREGPGTPRPAASLPGRHRVLCKRRCVNAHGGEQTVCLFLPSLLFSHYSLKKFL